MNNFKRMNENQKQNFIVSSMLYVILIFFTPVFLGIIFKNTDLSLKTELIIIAVSFFLYAYFCFTGYRKKWYYFFEKPVNQKQSLEAPTHFIASALFGFFGIILFFIFSILFHLF